MMKKLYALVAALMVSVAANAQFEQGKFYMNGSLTGLNMSYSGNTKFNMGASGQMGYMVADDWLVYGSLAYNHYGSKDISDTYSFGVGGRYYIEQNGIYLGASLNYSHMYESCDDFQPSVQVGYAFFLSRTVTVEPEIYYNQSFKSHKDYSKVGFRIGIGVYL